MGNALRGNPAEAVNSRSASVPLVAFFRTLEENSPMLRPRSHIFWSVLLLLGFSAPAFAAEHVDTFHARIAIEPAGTLLVSETIRYDFGTTERHGIYRDIPLKYTAAYGNYTIRVQDIEVTDKQGGPAPFTLERQGSQQRIRIGDPDQFVSGLQTYEIRYRVARAINFFEGYDELYWNVTGNAWDVSMQGITAIVELPEGAKAGELTTRCYSGPAGSDAPCASPFVPEDKDASADSVTFRHTALEPAEGLTIVVQFPKGLVNPPTSIQRVQWLIQDNWSIAVPFIVFGIMYYLWVTRGKDPKGRGVIIAEYDAPDKLTPAEIGTVLDEVTGNTDIAGEIVYLAVQGYLRIKQVTVDKLLKDKEEYIFQQLKPIDTALAPYQQTLLRGFFETRGTASTEPGVLKEIVLSDLKNTFATTLATVKSEATKSVVEKGYFEGNPNAPKVLYAIIAVILGILMVVFSKGSLLMIVSGIISGLIVAIFGWFMSRRSAHGVLTKEHILGLKDYLQVAEADRLKFHNAPEKKPEVFEKLLPYAIVLGVEKQWADQFKDIYTTEPTWYQGSYPGHFNTALFVNNLNALSSQTNSVLSSSPSSGAGGGGFSGGGFGGGGGGSW